VEHCQQNYGPLFLDRPVFHLAAIIVVAALFPVAA